MTLTLNSNSVNDILIVDDTLDNVRLLSDILTYAGFTVRKAISGMMALNAVKARMPDIILLDINMPEMSGFEVCCELKQDPETQDIPIIFLSASDMTSAKVEAFQIGGNDYITKPFYAEEVIARIQHQLLISKLKADLTRQNQDLEMALSNLKATQVELIQKEKMIGLSQLIAGIAHEINNPVSFIVGNLQPAKQYFLDLMHIIKLYQKQYPTPEGEIKTAIAEADLDFIVQDFPEIFKSMENGTNRICKIVRSLQTFSQQEKAAVKATNMHETLDSILTLLQPRFRGQGKRPSICVKCNYGDLPLVTCDSRLINQAILHILDNAIDAIDALWSKEDFLEKSQVALREPEIAIATHFSGSDVIAIRIRDNGIGIAEAEKPRIFDPFFTTKPVGQGEGLGLSVSYQVIVNKHRGSLHVQSIPLEGSEFIIELPIEFCAYSRRSLD